MAKILLLPLLNIPSGHHQVADATSRWLLTRGGPNVEIEKIELLSFLSPILERMVTKTYLKWIHYFPQLYHSVYLHVAYKSDNKVGSIKSAYNFLFLNQMEKLIKKTNPDLIICSHSLPSYLLSQLKQLKKINVPVVNVYTDFFINNIWGRQGVDLHLVPDFHIKEELIRKGANPLSIKVTGIPIDQAFTPSISRRKAKQKEKLDVLVAGGSIGIGLENSQSLHLLESKNIHYHVLCGKNNRLYEKIKHIKHESLTPLPYISSREEMNKLYDQMDAIITKPGGVTISECIFKRLPIFIYSVLPGQEEINFSYLQKKGLVTRLNMQQPWGEQINQKLRDEQHLKRWEQIIDHYQSQLEWDQALLSLSNFLHMKTL